jgi:two-component system, NarL family, nitrate/nitrite response regulator NarL
MTPSFERKDDAQRLLTERERQIAALVGLGYPNKFIARRLNLAEGTVKVHLHAVFQKLDIRSRTELIIKLSNR